MDAVEPIPHAYVPYNSSIQPQASDEQTQMSAKNAEPVKPSTPPAALAYFKTEISAAKRERKLRASGIKNNIDSRLGTYGRTFALPAGGMTPSDTDIQAEINPDWALTKTKTANLFSQTPVVYLQHENSAYETALPSFSRALNYEIGAKRAKVGVAMEECMNDVVNAAGYAAIYVGYTARFETKKVPTIDVSQYPPDVVDQGIAQGLIPSKDTQSVVSDRIFAARISPTDLLWPKAFTGSDFDDGPWIGYSGSAPWAEAKNEWGLKDEWKEQIVKDEDKISEEDLRQDPDKEALVAFESVRFERLFYWRYKVDPDEKNMKAIWEIVFVHGREIPVVDRPWLGQELDPATNKYVGASRFPVRVLTLTYVTDNPMPPSDTAIGRPQVRDMIRSRQQMFLNRDRSAPMRWFDVNRISRDIQDQLMKGTFQGMIPVAGDGTRSIGEIARASYPAEDMAFDRQTKADLQEAWQISSSQLGIIAPGERTKGEVDTTQQNFSTNMGRERNRVANFFLGVVEVIAGYMTLYSDFPILTQEEKAAMDKIWNNKVVCHDLVFKILPDSTIVLDSEQKIQRIQRLINSTAMSGIVDITPGVTTLIELHGEDPARWLKKPEQPKPEPAKISYSFAGKDDMMNAIVIAILKKNGQFPSDAEIEEAKRSLMAAAIEPGAAPVAPAQPAVPVEGAPFNENRDFQLPPTVTKRERDMEGGGAIA